PIHRGVTPSCTLVRRKPASCGKIDRMRALLLPPETTRRALAPKLSAVVILLLVVSGCGGYSSTMITTGPPPPQTLQTLASQPPDGAGIGFLLTDGSVIFQGGNFSDWSKLTPDDSGSYLKGTWSQIASLPA